MEISRSEVAKVFYETLGMGFVCKPAGAYCHRLRVYILLVPPVLQTHDVIKTQQDQPYGDIRIWRGAKWSDVLRSVCAAPLSL
mgnify:CR=1 FL=1